MGREEKNRKAIPEKTVRLLWARSAGRCAFDGCNKILSQDARTKRAGNRGHIAHIVAAEPTGARGHLTRSAQLCTELSNLMLVCFDCHDEIDNLDTRQNYPEERLLQMKFRHEYRIERQTAVQDDRVSELLFFGAKIGEHDSPLSFKECSLAMAPDYFPASNTAIILGSTNSGIKDNEELYWQYQHQNLDNQFARKVADRVTSGEINHLSVFALAPQPLLIRLGTLLGDITTAIVYQRHREPPGWAWRTPGKPTEFVVHRPTTNLPKVALNVSLSATVTNDRIEAVLGPDCAIWTLTQPEPGNDFIRTPDQVAAFRACVRQLLNDIKATHGQHTELHLFPCMPVALAVELGRVRMPKADVPFVVYDQNHLTGGFSRIFTIH